MSAPESTSIRHAELTRVSWPLGFAAVNGLLAVAGGALVAHKLAGVLGERELATLTTALDYQGIQGLALLILAIWDRTGSGGVWIRRACGAFVLGICLFSGSLYLLVCTDWRLVAYLTPLGGMSLMAGWGFLLIAAMGAVPMKPGGRTG